MVQVEEIVDREIFQAWLEALPEARRYEVAVGLATRCALRVFPIWAAEMHKDRARKGDLTPLPLFRSMMISGVGAKMPTPPPPPPTPPPKYGVFSVKIFRGLIAVATC